MESRKKRGNPEKTIWISAAEAENGVCRSAGDSGSFSRAVTGHANSSGISDRFDFESRSDSFSDGCSGFAFYYLIANVSNETIKVIRRLMVEDTATYIEKVCPAKERHRLF